MLKTIVLSTLASFIAVSSSYAYDIWVIKDSLNRYTCPDIRCGMVGAIYHGQKVELLDEKEGWTRITKYYDASCLNGVSQFVDSGNNKCTQDNGIINGQMAEWVQSEYLSLMKPEKTVIPKEDENKYRLVKASDDFNLYKDQFASLAKKLIADGKCTEKDFIETGGWLKSTLNNTKPKYFTYCGGFKNSNKIYMSPTTK